MLLNHPTTIWARRSAFSGAVVWLVLFLVTFGDSPETGLIQRLVLFAILVVVPLALSLVPKPEAAQQRSLFFDLAVFTQPLGALAAVASFMFEPGWVAVALIVPWSCVTVILSLLGIARLRRPELLTAGEVSISVALLYLPVAGFWLIVSRLGVQLAGFGDTIILLTAIHFHYAAYGAPILAGLAGRYLRRRQSGNRAFVFAAIGVIGGIPFVAVGITFSPLVALFGALLMAAGLFVLAILVVALIAPRSSPLLARILLSVSAVSSAVAIVMACAYAYSIVTKTLIFDIPLMAKTHGLINAFGFVLCGLIGWSLVRSSDDASH